MHSIELFSGCGGLGLGISRAGFEPVRLVEMNDYACSTLRAWRDNGVARHRRWNLFQGDVHKMDFRRYAGSVDLVAGGPPCQPFSVGGKHRGHEDNRNLFPEMFRAIREIGPKAVIIENVSGLGRDKFAEYFAYIQFQLKYITNKPRRNEDWKDHYQRLLAHETAKGSRDYTVLPLFVDAVDFGVPQRRKRIKFVCFRSDLNVQWPGLHATHSEDALLHCQWVTGEYWERHGVAKRHRPDPTPKEKAAAKRLKADGPGDLLPWRTVRDAIEGLPDPRKGAGGYANHHFVDGARQYPGHTGSLLDRPSKALKAGDHGVPGGENMIDYGSGVVRYYTVREAARIQTFPDWYELAGPWTEAMRQLGNAVPVLLANTVASLVRECVERAEGKQRSKYAKSSIQTPILSRALVRSSATAGGAKDAGRHSAADRKGRKTASEGTRWPRKPPRVGGPRHSRVGD